MYTFHPAVAGTVSRQLLEERVRAASSRSAARAIRQERLMRAPSPARRRRRLSLAVLRRSFG
jgi:hypothetical protein